ncbi:MAG: hypothetical protein U5R06_19170 [candidate division KSB1 bacterium]|nr:hypothetical protein [candidate division KSB1 bacterium]
MVWQGGACVSCVSGGGDCSLDAHCCAFDEGKSYCENGFCTETDDPCTLTSPLWSALGSINELEDASACCEDVLHGTHTVYDDWLPVTVYG